MFTAIQPKPEDISADRREANMYAAKNANSIIRARFAEDRVKELQRAVDLMHTEGDEDAEVLGKLKARIKELEADLAVARTVPAHKLVADVVMAVRAMRDAVNLHDRAVTTRGVIDALAALDSAGITVQPARTYTREEAEALRDKLDEAWAKWGEMKVGDPFLAAAMVDAEVAGDAIVNALMGVPAQQQAQRTWTKEETDRPLRALIKAAGDAVLARGTYANTAIKACDEARAVVERMLMGVPVPPDPRDAVEAPAGITVQQVKTLSKQEAEAKWDAMLRDKMMSYYGHNRAPQGSDEAGGEGPAAGPPKVDHLELAEAALKFHAPATAVGHILAHLRERT
jgi:hypothetical protein